MKQFKFSWLAIVFNLALSLMLSAITTIPAAALFTGISLIAFIPLPKDVRLANLGYAPYLLRHIREVAKGNTPSEKITSPGYMLYLAQSGASPNVVNAENSPAAALAGIRSKLTALYEGGE